MFVSENLTVNEKGNLAINGADTVALAKKYGTPLYVMDEDMIRTHCRTYIESIKKYYGGQGMACFASKAFSCKEIYRVMQQEGMGIDIVSAGEMYTAFKAGFDMSKAVFHGNNKTEEEINMAAECGVGRIVADNIYEIEALDRIAGERGIKYAVLLRIKPGVDAHTHSFISTGQIDSKFGFALETGEAFEAVKKVIDCKNIDFRGVHCHIGSSILDTQGFVAAAEIMMKFIKQIKDELNFEVTELNLGGGFGIRYVESDDPLPYDEFMNAVARVVNPFCESNGIKRPFILIEPGRSIVGPAGITLYRAGGRKTIPNIRTYISVDGGMCDNPRYIMYQAEYDAVVANKASEPKSERVTIAGRCCETGDMIGENMPLQHCEPGDIIAVCATGAYNYSMSSNYNRLCKPAVVFVNSKSDRLVVKRETLDDIIGNDI
ncbi:MAG: diaminopimelate decarboxylase [Oscillospiraceae bacterium]|nr:diaminopimelate decarboxylase [Oscillospiraceae bacterium]